jgi:xanthine/uracil permease
VLRALILLAVMVLCTAVIFLVNGPTPIKIFALLITLSFGSLVLYGWKQSRESR